jgi:KaiC/GvpD/RAD55 family RecA-like ATPase
MNPKDYVRFGIDELDKLLGGGLIRGSLYLIEVEPDTQEMSFVTAFLREGLAQGNFCSIFLYDRPVEELVDRLESAGVEVERALKSSQMGIVDLYSSGTYDPEHKGPIFKTENPSDPTSALRLFTDLGDEGVSRMRNPKLSAFKGVRTINLSLSSEIMIQKFEPTYKLVRIGSQMLKQLGAIHLSLLDPRMFDQTVVTAIEHIYDGLIALSMKETKGKFQRYLRVKDSPIGGFHNQEVPYDIVDGKPRFLMPPELELLNSKS